MFLTGFPDKRSFAVSDKSLTQSHHCSLVPIFKSKDRLICIIEQNLQATDTSKITINTLTFSVRGITGGRKSDVMTPKVKVID